MKTTKKILAALLVVMMLVMMVPFTASAATSYSAEITGKAGYTIDVYKIADVNTTTGAYSNTLSTEIANILKKTTDAGVDSAALLTACEVLSESALGSSLYNATFDSTEKITFTTTTAGIFYVKVTGTPEGVSVKKSGGSILSLPYYVKDTNSWETSLNNLTLKIEDGTVSVDKFIVEGSNKVTSTTANIGDTITFELTASVTGSLEAPLTEYTIHDTMSKGLDTPAVVSVYVDDTKLTLNSDYTVDTTDLTDIKISLTEAYLTAAADEENDFYASSNVIVTLTAILNEEATIGKDADLTNDNTNSDSLTYTNKYGQESVPGDTVRVYTFDLNVEKVDATDTTKKLSGASFTLYNADNAVVKTLTTDSTGTVTFTGLKAGTYTVKETAAPAGYSINSDTFTVVISADGVVTFAGEEISVLTVEDTPIVLPATGGMGTMMFTIIGASLIVCAGVLFLVVRRKKATK